MGFLEHIGVVWYHGKWVVQSIWGTVLRRLCNFMLEGVFTSALIQYMVQGLSEHRRKEDWSLGSLLPRTLEMMLVRVFLNGRTLV